MEMKGTIEILRKKVDQSFYLRPSPYNFDIGEIMQELRKDKFYDKFPDSQLVEYAIEKGLKDFDIQTEVIVSNLKNQDGFKNYTENQLYEYAYALQGRDSMYMFMTEVHSYTDHSKPNDPIWGQYSYEEILEMEAGGVEIPEEFLEWAHAQQDANSFDYDVKQEGSEDQNTVENLDNSTNNDTQASVQKKAQAFSSQAEAQQNLVEEESAEAEKAAQEVTDKQDELLSDQQDSIEETEELMQEWKALDQKALNGTMTEAEKSRYLELSTELSSNDDEQYKDELDSLNNDIDELMGQMSKINMLIDVNDKINRELEDTSVRMSGYEGNKKHGYLSGKNESGKVGVTDSMNSEALSGNVGKNTAIKGTKLNFGTIDIQNNQDSNTALGEAARQKLDEAKQLVKDNENDKLNTNVTPRSVKETKDDDESVSLNNKTDDTNSKEGEETVIAMAPVDIAQESDKINTVQKPEENQPVEGAAKTDVPAEPSDDNNISAKTEGAEQTTGTTAADEADSVEETEETEATDEVETETDTVAEEQDEDTIAAQESLTSCNSKSSELEAAGNEVTSLLQQVSSLKDNRLLDEVKMQTGIKTKLKEYQKLAQKAQSGKELTSSDMAKISQLESSLDSNNGEYAAEIQSKLSTLSAYSSAVAALQQLSEDGETFGAQTVEQGKAYAEKEMGDKTSEVKRKKGYILLSKEKRYDLLYGKSGESLGRDLIDSGESLINSSSKNIKKSNNIIYKATEKFVQDYSDSLSERLTNLSSFVSPLQSQIAQAIASQQAKEAEKANETNSNQQPDNVNTLNSTEENVKRNTNNSAVPEPEQIALNPAQTLENEAVTTVDTGKKNNINSKISANQQNAQKITALNSDSANANREIEQTVVSYNSAANSITNNEESNTDKISLNSDKIPEEGATPASLRLAVNTNETQKSVSTENTSKLKSMERRMPQLANNIDTNGRSVDRIVSESLNDTPEFDDETKVQENAYNASVTALNAAAGGKVVNGTTVSLGNNVKDNSKNILSDNSNDNDTVKVVNDIVDEGSKAIETEEDDEEDIVPVDESEDEEVTGMEDEISEGETVTDEGYVEEARPVTMSDNTTEDDIEKELLDNLMAQSDENAEMMKDNGTKLLMENQAREAAKQALNEPVESGGFRASGAANASVGDKLNKDNSKTETGRSRRFISYEAKNRRAVLADKVESGKKVVMKRGKKKQ